MRGLWIAGAVAASLAAVGMAQAQQRLPRECRQEIRALCGSDRSQIRSCLREKHSELSESCAGELRERMQQRRAGQEGRPTRLPPQKFDLITYGDHLKQAVDYYRANNVDSAPPLVLFVHGGGWTIGDRTRTAHAKPDHFTANGYAFASTGYRLLPEAPVEDQARDVALAIRTLRAQADELGFDANRIVLMGHSAGAHLAALVSTDPAYAGEDMAAIRGVVLLDGAGYDVPANMARGDVQLPRLYKRVFGSDPARQAALSPITHVGAPDAADWLILHVANRRQSRDQSEALGAKLRDAGVKAEVVAVENTDHGRMNRELGKGGDAATAAVDGFLNRLFS